MPKYQALICIKIEQATAIIVIKAETLAIIKRIGYRLLIVVAKIIIGCQYRKIKVRVQLKSLNGIIEVDNITIAESPALSKTLLESAKANTGMIMNTSSSASIFFM